MLNGYQRAYIEIPRPDYPSGLLFEISHLSRKWRRSVWKELEQHRTSQWLFVGTQCGLGRKAHPVYIFCMYYGTISISVIRYEIEKYQNLEEWNGEFRDFIVEEKGRDEFKRITSVHVSPLFINILTKCNILHRADSTSVIVHPSLNNRCFGFKIMRRVSSTRDYVDRLEMSTRTITKPKIVY